MTDKLKLTLNWKEIELPKEFINQIVEAVKVDPLERIKQKLIKLWFNEVIDVIELWDWYEAKDNSWYNKYFTKDLKYYTIWYKWEIIKKYNWYVINTWNYSKKYYTTDLTKQSWAYAVLEDVTNIEFNNLYNN